MTCYDTSRAPDRRRAPHTGRGSDSLVLIEASGFYPKFYGNSVHGYDKLYLGQASLFWYTGYVNNTSSVSLSHMFLQIVGSVPTLNHKYSLR